MSDLCVRPIRQTAAAVQVDLASCQDEDLQIQYKLNGDDSDANADNNNSNGSESQDWSVLGWSQGRPSEPVKSILKPCAVLSKSKLLAVYSCDDVQPHIADLSTFKQMTDSTITQ